jgi:hypothetical protein
MERYGVFGMFVDGSPTYVGSTDDLTLAKAAMRDAVRRTALDYFVCDFELGQNVAASFEDGGPAVDIGDCWAT